MTFSVFVTDDARRDLDDIYSYIASHDGITQANSALDAVEAALAKLTKFPLRGEHPPELLALGMREFRQAHYKPYRMIYQVHESSIYVLVVADGRRDMQTLLQRRLLGG